MKIHVVTFQNWRKDQYPSDQVVITVSASKNWSKGLSPFILGPCALYDGIVARNVENSWQYAKVYPCHTSDETATGEIKEDYWIWAREGWNNSQGVRYPMGKGAKPLFSLWKKNGEYKRLSYIDARKQIYIPLYWTAVKNTSAFYKLKKAYEVLKEEDKDLYLVDFDAYRHHDLGMTYKQVINNPNKTMGHAFVLAMGLECPDKLERSIAKMS